jgi:hypothetical protein
MRKLDIVSGEYRLIAEGTSTMSYEKLTIIGNLGQEPELCRLEDSTAVTNLVYRSQPQVQRREAPATSAGV